MRILLIDNGTKHLGRLKDLLIRNEIEIHTMFQKYPPFENYDLIILSGGSQLSIKDVPEVFTEEINLIKTSTKPIIGICEGCEIVAYTFRSKLEYQNIKTKGVKTIQIINQNFFDFPKEIDVYEAHHWAIKNLGKELIGIARSEHGWEIIKHNKSQIFGFQFHPEMLINKTMGDEIFRMVVGNITK